MLLIPAAAAWQGKRVRVVWEHGVPAEADVVRPVRRSPVVGDLSQGAEEAPAAADAPLDPRPPYPLHDPLIELMALPGGTFWMGSDKTLDPQAYDDERPRRQVNLAPFAIAITPISRGLYRSVMKTLPRVAGRTRTTTCPANNLTWKDAVGFCNALSEQSGLRPCYREADGGWKCDWDADGYRLPTEAEWEYACRAGTETPWFWGGDEKDAGRHAWFSGNSDGKPHAVGEKAANPWGLHDMAGNVWEWCWDWYAETYDPKDLDNPRGPARGAWRVLRGGSFLDGPRDLRSAVRFRVEPGARDGDVGFRCVRGSVRQLDR